MEKKDNSYSDNSIFKSIDPTSNDILSDLKGFDLQDLIISLDDYLIEYRKRINLEQYITIGLEIEFEHESKKIIENQIEDIFLNNPDWKMKEEYSLQRGGEIISPILRDTEENWEDLKIICSLMDNFQARESDKCGSHIHVGSQTLGKQKQSWMNFIKLWAIYENIIFRFAYGEYLNGRPKITTYAYPISAELLDCYKVLSQKRATLLEILCAINKDKYQAVNFRNVIGTDCDKMIDYNTIEFRCPNGTLDPAIWQNNANFFIRLLLYSKSNKYNKDIIQRRERIIRDKINDLHWYNEIYLEQALELCDMIFTNNLDKLNFLKQYLKSFQICEDIHELKKGPVLTKK